VNLIGVFLVVLFISLLVLTVIAAVRFRRRGGTSEDLSRSAEEVAKWYEITPGG